MVVARFYVGDVFERLAELPDASVDFVMTSPPFLALRSYLPEGHPLKPYEIGSEKTPAAFLDRLLLVTAELRRVLAPHGSICIELGDTYSGSGGAGGDYRPGGMRDGTPGFDGSASRKRRPRFREGVPRWDRQSGERTTTSDPLDAVPARAHHGWPMAKSLTGIPTLYAFSLAYGFNLLSGEGSPAGQWRIRNLVHWVRPNPPVGALGDKFRPATSYLVCACISPKRWFDLDAVRTPLAVPEAAFIARPTGTRERDRQGRGRANADGFTSNPAGAPPLDWWKLSTRGYKGAHYAVYPPELCERPIKAMCPERVCVECGEPSRRITERNGELDASRPQSARAMELAKDAGLTPEHIAAIRSFGISDAGKAQVTQTGYGRNTERVQQLAAEAKDALGGYFREFLLEVPKTTGWTNCGHDAWRNGVVLDPFAGTGTTLLVANQLGRDAIGIDLDERNAALALERVGRLDVVDTGSGVYRNVRKSTA